MPHAGNFKRVSALRGWIDNGHERFYGEIVISADGVIAGVRRLNAPSSFDPRTDALIRAGQFNAHSHPEQSIYAGLTDKTWDLGTWCRNTIYKYSTAMTPRRVRLACRRAFARMTLLGVTSVMVSFYLHGGGENDREVIAAARDVGIRLIFGRMNYDIVNADAYAAKKASQMAYYETIPQAEANLRALMAEEDETVTVCPALHSFHASTAACIEHGIRLGWELKRPVQLHLSEDRGDVELCLREHGCRPVVYLQRLLDEGSVPSLAHVVLSDCCWLDDEERAIIARTGMRVVLNPRMNDRVKTGFPDVPALYRAGIPIWLGTDGEASNDSLNPDDERAFLKLRCPDLPADAVDTFGTGAFACGRAFVGPLEAGAWADLRVTRNGRVESVYMGGRPIVSDGNLTLLDAEADIEAPLNDEIAAMTAE